MLFSKKVLIAHGTKCKIDAVHYIQSDIRYKNELLNGCLNLS